MRRLSSRDRSSVSFKAQYESFGGRAPASRIKPKTTERTLGRRPGFTKDNDKLTETDSLRQQKRRPDSHRLNCGRSGWKNSGTVQVPFGVVTLHKVREQEPFALCATSKRRDEQPRTIHRIIVSNRDN